MSHDARAAAGVPGLIAVVATETWLAAAAQTWHAASRAVTAMAPRFHRFADDDSRVVDSGACDAILDAALAHGTATRLWAQGDADALLDHPSLTARYDIAPAFHAPLETASATARISHGTLELWIATQAPEAAAEAAARGAGVARSAVIVYPLAAGGSFDARLDVRIAEQVALIARRLNRPVQLTYDRWQETLADAPRAPMAAAMAAAFDPARTHLLGWRARLATPAWGVESGARLFGGQDAYQAQATAREAADPVACSGAMPAYAIPARAVDHVPVSLSLPGARLRGGADGMTAFITESFIDECAHWAGAEPLAFRIAMLGHAPRLVACLEGAGQMATWGGGAAGSGQGLACHSLTIMAPEGRREGHIAVIASAHADQGTIRVDSLSAYCDIGRVINLDIARQQIEGGLWFGLDHALGGAARYAAGLPGAGRIGQMGFATLAQCPKVTVAFAPSDAEPFDPGDLGMVAVAPAVANALFSASGTRFRRLPLLP